MLLVALIAAVDGVRAVAGAVLGGLLVLLAMAVAPLVMRAARRWSPPAVMAVALLAYGATVIVLGAVYLALGNAEWLSSAHLGVALIACCGAWTAGGTWVTARVRILAFGAVDDTPGEPDSDAASTPDGPGQGESAGPEPSTGHW